MGTALILNGHTITDYVDTSTGRLKAKLEFLSNSVNFYDTWGLPCSHISCCHMFGQGKSLFIEARVKCQPCDYDDDKKLKRILTLLRKAIDEEKESYDVDCDDIHSSSLSFDEYIEIDLETGWITGD